MKVLLVCAAGMSTSLLTTKMRKEGGPGDVVEAVPVGELEAHIDNYDVVLLGPQIRFKLKEVETLAASRGKKASIIDMRVYGTMDGKAAMDQARALLD
ncbi:MAG: PTS sugar transporter subunit IIB [Ancrocorticia sp.]